MHGRRSARARLASTGLSQATCCQGANAKGQDSAHAASGGLVQGGVGRARWPTGAAWIRGACATITYNHDDDSLAGGRAGRCAAALSRLCIEWLGGWLRVLGLAELHCRHVGIKRAQCECALWLRAHEQRALIRIVIARAAVLTHLFDSFPPAHKPHGINMENKPLYRRVNKC